MKLDPNLLVLVRSNGIGGEEPDLAERLMRNFLMTLGESGQLPARMIFLNAGIFATTEGSTHLEALQRLADAGTEIRSCITCLEYYGRRDMLRIGVTGTMRDTVAAIHQATKVVTL